MSRFAWCAAALTMFCAGTALASSLAYEGFDYVPGPLPGNNGGLGFLAPWAGDPTVVVQPPGLSHPLGLPSSGQEIGGGFVVSRELAASLSQPEYWASFQINSDPGNDQVWLGLDTLPTSLPAIAFGRRLDTYFLQAGGGLAKLGGVASPAGVTDLLVARLIQTGLFTQVDVWVNTNDFTLPPLLNTTVPSVAYTWVNVEVQPGLFADEVRVGTTADSVAAPEPEPGSCALMAVALLVFGFSSNRRNRRR